MSVIFPSQPTYTNRLLFKQADDSRLSRILKISLSILVIPIAITIILDLGLMLGGFVISGSKSLIGRVTKIFSTKVSKTCFKESMPEKNEQLVQTSLCNAGNETIEKMKELKEKIAKMKEPNLSDEEAEFIINSITENNSLKLYLHILNILNCLPENEGILFKEKRKEELKSKFNLTDEQFIQFQSAVTLNFTLATETELKYLQNSLIKSLIIDNKEQALKHAINLFNLIKFELDSDSHLNSLFYSSLTYIILEKLLEKEILPEMEQRKIRVELEQINNIGLNTKFSYKAFTKYLLNNDITSAEKEMNTIKKDRIFPQDKEFLDVILTLFKK